MLREVKKSAGHPGLDLTCSWKARIWRFGTSGSTPPTRFCAPFPSMRAGPFVAGLDKLTHEYPRPLPDAGLIGFGDFQAFDMRRTMTGAAFCRASGMRLRSALGTREIQGKAGKGQFKNYRFVAHDSGHFGRAPVTRLDAFHRNAAGARLQFSAVRLRAVVRALSAAR